MTNNFGVWLKNEGLKREGLDPNWNFMPVPTIVQEIIVGTYFNQDMAAVC